VIAALAGIAVGLAAIVGLLIVEGVPSSPAIETSTTTTLSHTRKSGCPITCKKPQTTDTEVTVTSRSPSESGGRSVLEQALDNDFGVIALRIVFALLAALVTTAVVRRILLDLLVHGDGPGGAAPPARPKGKPKGSGGKGVTVRGITHPMDPEDEVEQYGAAPEGSRASSSEPAGA
jgi:hypothetical protein